MALLACAGAVSLRGPSSKNMTVTAKNAIKFQRVDALRKNANWHKNKVPKHLKIETIPVVALGGCGNRISAKSMGLKRSSEAVRIWKDKSLLQLSAPEHPGRNSWAQPGAGVGQTVADNGLGTVGKIGEDEVYVKVLKDGFFEVGCYHDAMLEFADMYGKGKFKYNMANTNTSIALYTELTLKDEQVAMSPQVCFEFCRTVPLMVYFGISEGNKCYCTPYYKPQAGDDKQCDQPCEGESTSFCGNMKGKSTIWEMHLCDTIATELQTSLSQAKEALDFFFENALLAMDLGTKMKDTGIALKETAGLSGGPKSAANGLAANVASQALTQAYQEGRKDYTALLGFYNDGKAVESEDMSLAASADKAQTATRFMKQMTTVVLGKAGSIHADVVDAYPPADKVVFGDEPDSADQVATALAKGIKAEDYRTAPYAYGDTEYAPQATSCEGPTIGLPKVGLGTDGCAVACEGTLFPEKCVAFTSYSMDGLTDLCFLHSNVITVEAFECQEDAAALVQAGGKKDKKGAAAVCKIKMSEISTGFKPKGELVKMPRCFGSDKDFALATDVTEMSLPADTEVKVGASQGITKAE